MKKIFTLLTALLFGLATLTQAAPLTYLKQAPAQHLTKNGKPDKRYNENKHLTKAGKPDMRYNTSKKAANKKTTQKKH